MITDFSTLRQQALYAPRIAARGALPAEHIMHAGNGYYIGLSVNA